MYGGFVIGRVQFDFGGFKVLAAASPSQRVGSNR
jgi:hypothetical protein